MKLTPCKPLDASCCGGCPWIGRDTQVPENFRRAAAGSASGLQQTFRRMGLAMKGCVLALITIYIIKPLQHSRVFVFVRKCTNLWCCRKLLALCAGRLGHRILSCIGAGWHWLVQKIWILRSFGTTFRDSFAVYCLIFELPRGPLQARYSREQEVRITKHSFSLVQEKPVDVHSLVWNKRKNMLNFEHPHTW